MELCGLYKYIFSTQLHSEIKKNTSFCFADSSIRDLSLLRDGKVAAINLKCRLFFVFVLQIYICMCICISDLLHGALCDGKVEAISTYDSSTLLLLYNRPCNQSLAPLYYEHYSPTYILKKQPSCERWQ